jgi:hypothetical protein
MALSNNLRSGNLYYYEFENERAIGEYKEEIIISEEDVYVTIPMRSSGVDRYIIELWSEDSILSHTYLGNNSQEDLIIIKDLGSACIAPELEDILKSLEDEFPEYFI